MSTPKPATPTLDRYRLLSRDSASNHEAAIAVREHDALIAWYEADNNRLRDLIEDAASHWLDLNNKHQIPWEGGIDAAMKAACDQIRSLTTRLSAPKRLARPSYKGVTYLDGKYVIDMATYSGDDAVSTLIAVLSGFTDADHAPLMALKDAQPMDTPQAIANIIVRRLGFTSDGILSDTQYMRVALEAAAEIATLFAGDDA